MNAQERFATHAVENQPPPLAPYNAWTTDRALREAVKREGGAWAQRELNAYGAVVGGELMELGFAANENKPKLKTFDRYGHRIDEVEFHPAWHRVMQLDMSAWRARVRLAQRGQGRARMWRARRSRICTGRSKQAPAAR